MNVMKNFYRLILAATTMLAAASCAENLETDSSETNVGNMVFSSVVDAAPVSKTTYSSQKVYWEAEDHITVFAVSDETLASDFKVTKLSEDKATATFEGVSDLDCETYYAVYPHSSTNAFDAQAGKLTVSLPAVQTAVPDGFESGSNVSVACSDNVGGNQGSLQFRNVTTLVCLQFDSLDDAFNTKSITVRAKKNDGEYWGLAGTAQVQIGEDGIPVVGEGSETSVTLSAPADGFKTDVIYYVPVYAVGACTGLEVTFKAVNDNDYVKTNDTAAELTRNWLFNIGAVPEPYPYADDLNIHIDFRQAAWPFVGDGPVSEQSSWTSGQTQSTIGEAYDYIYTDSNNFKRVLQFRIAQGKSSDTITPDNYSWSQADGLKASTSGHNYNMVVMFPGIDDYYLTNVVVKQPAASTASNRLGLAIEGGTFTMSSIIGSGTVTFWLYEDMMVTDPSVTWNSKNGKAAKGVPFFLRYRDKGYLYSLDLTYSKTSPGNAPAAE